MLSHIASPPKGIPLLRIAPAPGPRENPIGYASAVAGLALAYFLLAKISLHLAFKDTNASPVWPPSGVGFAALLLFGPRLWPGIFLGAFMANLSGFLAHHGSLSPKILAVSALIGLGNSSEAALSVLLARKWLGNRKFGDAFRGMKFGGIVAVACALSAAVGSISLCMAGLATWELLPAIARTWWLGDAVGILVVSPFLVSVGNLTRAPRSPKRIVEGILFLVLLLFFAYEVFDREGYFGGVQPLAYTITPLLILIAFRCHASVAYLGMIFVSGIAVLETLSGAGPFSGQDTHSQLLLLQAFAGVVSLTLLYVAESLAERDEALRDLTGIKQGLETRVAERTAEFRLSESRFRQLSDAGFEGLVIHDMGNIQLANQAAGRMFRTTPAEFIGKSLPEYLAPESIAPALANMKAGSALPMVSIGLRSDGSRFHMEVRGRPIEYNGKSMRVVAIRDISERIKAEEMQVHAMEALESANRAKSQFLATVSHEIRTPLNGVIGMIHALTETRLDSEQQRYVRILETSGEALLDQVSGILDLAKIESGSMNLEATGFELRSMLEDALRPHAESARRRGLRFVHASEVAPGDMVEGDPKRLRQVIGNLVGNAVKFTSEGWVRVETRIADKGAILGFSCVVSDSGIGIRAETLPRLFKPFVQGDASMNRRFGGSGLGLAICKQLVELMGGFLTVESREGVGSSFRFECDFLRIPGKRGKPENASGLPTLKPEAMVKHGSMGLRKKVLVVEDDPVNQEVARIFLGKHACSVQFAGSGPEAISLNPAEEFDLILMDCQLPGMDGFATTAAIRASESDGRRVRIVAMTANAIQGDKERCLAAGMDDYLSKPLDAVRLAVIIDRMEGIE